MNPNRPRKQITGQDLTGNAGKSVTGGPASMPTRNLSFYQGETPAGDPAELDWELEEDATPPIQNDKVTFFNSRLDLEYDLPSTRKKYWK